MLIDSHCHLYMGSWADNLSEVLARSKVSGVSKYICPGIDLESSRKAINIAGNHQDVFAAAGIHPHDADTTPSDFTDQLERLLGEPKVVALGEIGLDYFRNYSDIDAQRVVFRKQLELAKEMELPVIIHNRNADDDVIKMLQEVRPINGVSHCFSSDLDTANSLLDMGIYISFAGNLTYKNSNLVEVARAIPIDKLLIETDAPFLSPVPMRGKENDPSRVKIIAEYLVDIRGTFINEIEAATTQNAIDLFSLPIE